MTSEWFLHAYVPKSLQLTPNLVPQNFGVATPAPTLALVVSGLVVGLAVFFLLQSGSRD